jgi:hypothetical protein
LFQRGKQAASDQKETEMTATLALPPRGHETPKFFDTVRIDEFPFESWRDASPYDRPSRSQQPGSQPHRSTQ